MAGTIRRLLKQKKYKNKRGTKGKKGLAVEGKHLETLAVEPASEALSIS